MANNNQLAEVDSLVPNQLQHLGVVYLEIQLQHQHKVEDSLEELNHSK